MNALRRQILAAQLKVALYNQLGCTTPVKVKRSASITLPPIEDLQRDCHLGFHSPAPEH